MIRRFCFLAIAFALPLYAADKKPSKSPKAKGEDKKAAALPYEVADFVENNFPFFSTTLDARELGEGFPKDNLTPRGIVLNLGHNLWACFDVDLLRIACIWQGEEGKAPISLVALAPRSYKDPGQKTKDGQDDLPKPVGKVWLANGIYPGWQVGTEAKLTDPREPCPSKDEVGRGPLPYGGLKAVRLTDAGVVLEYEVGGTLIKETVAALVDAGHLSIARTLTVGATKKPLVFIAGEVTQGERKRSKLPVPEQVTDESRLNVSKVAASDKEQTVKMGFDLGPVRDKAEAPTMKPAHWPQTLATKAALSTDPAAYVVDDIALPTTNPWKRNIRLADIAFLDDQGHAAAVTMDGDVWMISGLTGNLDNVQWKRFTSGFHEPMSIVWRPETTNRDKEEREKLEKAHAETQAGLAEATGLVDGYLKKYKQFAADDEDARKLIQDLESEMKLEGGLSKTVDEKLVKFQAWAATFAKKDAELPKLEKVIGLIKAIPQMRSSLSWMFEGYLPKSSAGLFVNDRNGIWKLGPANEQGECTVHEMFCNLFSQTAETREFPNSMKLGPDGSLYISKGGQQGTTLGKDNGKVLRIAPDGKSYEAVAWGLRQPFIGVNEKTGMVTASDQQGNYVPSTPLHIIRDNQYYGFLTEQTPHEKYPAPIADPLTWLPHPVNPSGATQVWLNNAKMGPLNDSMLHLAYSRADIFRVMFDSRQTKDQASVCNIPLPILFPPTNGKVNPADGQLYLVGFQIWGTTAQRVSGLARVRYNPAVASVLPNDLAAMDKGILVHFDSPVDKTLASNPDNFSVERWNYKRTFDYGSAHYKLDGTTGQEMLTASAAYVSEDGKSVFVSVPDMKKCDQMHLGWNIKSASGAEMQNNAYFTPWNFSAFDPAKEGFGSITVNLTPRIAIVKVVKPSVDEGKRLYQFIGCMGCHSVDGSVAGRLGPSWKGLFGSTRELSDDTKVVADEAYIRESILEPSKKKAKAYLKLETGMPIYAGILSESQIESIILYMKTLAK